MLSHIDRSIVSRYWRKFTCVLKGGSMYTRRIPPLKMFVPVLSASKTSSPSPMASTLLPGFQRMHRERLKLKRLM